MTEQEIKEKYPIGKRFISDCKRIILIISKQKSGHFKVYDYLNDNISLIELNTLESEFKPYTAPKTNTVYVHWWDEPNVCTVQDYKLTKNDECFEMLVAIKKVTLTEGEFEK